jgi:asparagine synthase (glutamine-hydrolysing)
MKLNGLTEKYILKRCAQNYLPSSIIQREKFSFVAPGSKAILKYEWVNDLLSADTIKRQGYFDTQAVERLKKTYATQNFTLNTTYETDLLLVVITFGIFLELFDMPNL